MTKKEGNDNIKWSLFLFVRVILKIISKFKPDKLILNLLLVSLQQVDSGVRELRMN